MLPDIVTVSASGKVSAIAEGTARITATAEGKSGSATVQVVPVPVATVLIGGPPELAVGDAAQLNVTLKDAKGGILRGRVISWSSSDSKVATVSPTGLTTAVRPGKRRSPSSAKVSARLTPSTSSPPRSVQ
jgi:uncharacterized protein YjdB